MELVNKKETYEVKYNDGSEKQPVFMLKKLTMDEVASIEDAIMQVNENNKFSYLSGTSKKLKIEFALRNWKNVTIDGAEVPCTNDNKRLLPTPIYEFLTKKIDEDNGLSNPTPEKVEAEKN